MLMSNMLSDGMVLQRNAKVPIWGKADAHQTIHLSFLDHTYSTITDANGMWMITLESLKPGGPFEMRIKGPEQLVIRNILVGDVWLLGGQSNMQLPVGRTLDLFEDEIKTVNEPFIRQFTVPQAHDFHSPQSMLTEGNWIEARPEDVLQFSAAGFFFAQDLYKKYGVPIGLILTAIGGTPIEAWISEETLTSYEGYNDDLELCKDDTHVAQVMKQDEDRHNAWYQKLNENDPGLKKGWFREDYAPRGWNDFRLPNTWGGSQLESMRGSVWFRREFELPDVMAVGDARLKLGTIVDADDTYINGVLIGTTGYQYPPRRYSIPEGVLKPGKNSITVRVISTQNIGEFIQGMPYKLIAANGQEIDLTGDWSYRIGTVVEQLEPQTFFHYKPCGLYNAMIAPLRNYNITGFLWYQGESNTESPKGYRHLFRSLVNDWRDLWKLGELPFIYTQLTNFGDPDPGAVNWAELREEQRRGLAVPNTAMAVTIDIGEHNDLHPQDKKTLGQRLALCAQKLAYGESLVYSGPMFTSMEIVGSTVHLQFDHCGSGLTVRGDEELKGFELCDSSGAFVPAQAHISGSQVIVNHAHIQQPHHVKYAWWNNPAEANLFNKEGLPASPFTTEE